MAQVLFITGADTGAGKTVLTALLLAHLRRSGCHALAAKPFCSGGRRDAQILCRAADGELSLDEINPFHFPEPVTPLLAARRAHRRIAIEAVADYLRTLADRCELLLVEGAGGLLSPLGESAQEVYSLADLIRRFGSPTIIAARNRLGVLNHVLLTVHALLRLQIPGVKIVLMGTRAATLATAFNARLLAERLSPKAVFELPYLGLQPLGKTEVGANEKKLKKTLAQILKEDTFSSAFRKLGSENGE